MNQIILSKDEYGNYVLKNGDKTELFPDWFSLLKNLPSTIHGFAKVVEGIPKVKGKFEMGRNEEIVKIPCINCGESFDYPIDTKHYPSLCSEQCKFEYETEVVGK